MASEWKLELRLPSWLGMGSTDFGSCFKDPWQVVRACFMPVPKLAITFLMPIGKLPQRRRPSIVCVYRGEWPSILAI